MEKENDYRLLPDMKVKQLNVHYKILNVLYVDTESRFLLFLRIINKAYYGETIKHFIGGSVMKKELSTVTKKVIRDLTSLSDGEFIRRYSVSKTKYRKRLARYGDPYMYAPLAKFGKFLKKLGS